ncbi:MAG: peptidoglycan-binding protein [Verrucomicrobiaceae bacterium]|nr:MAG: peptidoglycan-binding protein [Verrucomicrobiaceae bacterium]
MKTQISLLTTILLLAGSTLAGAAPWDTHSRRGPDSGRFEERYGRDDSRGGYARGHRMSLEARAQLKLRQLGYYRGPVDGDFGRGSRAALTRFQFRSGLRPTGWLDPRTVRALRL